MSVRVGRNSAVGGLGLVRPLPTHCRPPYCTATQKAARLVNPIALEEPPATPYPPSPNPDKLPP